MGARGSGTMGGEIFTHKIRRGTDGLYEGANGNPDALFRHMRPDCAVERAQAKGPPSQRWPGFFWEKTNRAQARIV